MPQKIAIRIDGEYVEAREGQTILEVARAGGKYIPTLCNLAGLTASGSCRLCVVEISGVGRLMPSCTTTVQDGMAVTTNSDKLVRYRKMALELLFAERNHYCAICVSAPSGGRIAREVRARPQPLCPVHALRAGVRGNRGRSRLGRLLARHSVHAGQRA